MKISLIHDDRVDNSKGGFLSHVDDTIEDVNTLDDFALLGTNFHIAPATFKDNRKKQDHLEQIQFLCYDFDDGITSSHNIHSQLFNRTNHVILASKNCFTDKGDGKGAIERFHLFIPLDEPITSVELYKFSCQKFAKLNLWKADKSCMEPARYFYKHSGVMFVYEKAKPLEVNRMKEMKELEDKYKPDPVFFVSDDTPPMESFQRTKYYRMMTDGALKVVGQRYDVSNRIVGAALKCGCSQEDIMSLFDQHSFYDASFTRNSVVKKIQDWK